MQKIKTTTASSKIKIQTTIGPTSHSTLIDHVVDFETDENQLR